MKQKFELWERVIKTLKLDTRSDLHLINREEIRAIAEDRLPSSFDRMDTYEDLPPVMRNSGYFLLQLSPRWLGLVRGNGFQWLETQTQVQTFESRIPFSLSTFSPQVSRFQALDNALNCGLLEQLLATGPLYRSGAGRLNSGFFDFEVRDLKLAAYNVRLEIDQVLESRDTLVLVKTGVAGQTNFNLQQAFYPYRYLTRMAQPRRVILLYFGYDPLEDRYDFWLYRLYNPRNPNSFELIQMGSYVILGLRSLPVPGPVYHSPQLIPGWSGALLPPSTPLVEIPQERLAGVN